MSGLTEPPFAFGLLVGAGVGYFIAYTVHFRSFFLRRRMTQVCDANTLWSAARKLAPHPEDTNTPEYRAVMDIAAIRQVHWE